MPIPFLDLIDLHRDLEEDLVRVFREAVRKAAFVGGPELEAFEREFAAYCDVPHCAAVANGTDALRFAYLALGVGPGDEIITVAHTFIATAETITQAGGAVRFVDITEESMTMDPAAAAAAVGPRTVGIVPVHLYGQPADLDPLLALVRRRGLWLVEDAAQAHGALYRGKRAGSLGHLGCLSFYPGKNLGSLGEGGAVTGSDAAVMERVRQLREHGQSSKYVHAREGYNGRLHAIQAAFLRIKLRRLDAWNAARRQVAAWYRDALGGLGDLRLPGEAPYAQHVYHLYVVRTAERDALRDYLGQRGIGTGLHYPVPLHLQRAYERLGLKPGALPVTERAAATCLSLPMFPGMSQGQVGCVADAVRDYFRAPPPPPVSPSTRLGVSDPVAKESAERDWKAYYRWVYPAWWEQRAPRLGWSSYDATLLDLLDARPGERVLECGVGTGERYAIRLAQRGVRVHGADLAGALLRQCLRHTAEAGGAITAQQADIEALPYRDGAFERVFSFSTLWYVPSLAAAVREMVRVTKPGGTIVFDLLNAFHLTPGLAYLATLTKRALGKAVGRWRPHSPLAIGRILSACPVRWQVLGFGVLLPTSLPVLGERADLARRFPMFDAGLRTSPLRYLGAKLVYVCRRTSP